MSVTCSNGQEHVLHDAYMDVRDRCSLNFVKRVSRHMAQLNG